MDANLQDASRLCLAETEQKQIVVDWNKTEVDYGPDTGLSLLFAEQGKQTSTDELHVFCLEKLPAAVVPAIFLLLKILLPLRTSRLAGIPVEWSEVHKYEKQQRVPLPTFVVVLSALVLVAARPGARSVTSACISNVSVRYQFVGKKAYSA